MPSLKLKLDVSKLDKSAFFKGTKGTYCDLVLWENDEPDQYGNTHSVKQYMGKDRRGEKTPYVGNAQPLGQRSPNQNNAAPPPLAAMNDSLDADDDIPF